VRRASHGLKKEVPPCHRVQTIKGLKSQETLTWNTRQRRKPFAVLSLLARIPDKPDYRQAPIDPFKYTPAWKGPRRTHRRSTSMGYGKFRGYSSKSNYCIDKQKWMSEYDCEECPKYLSVPYYGKICQNKLDWHIEVTEAFARDKDTQYFSDRSWFTLREYGGEEFRAMVEEHDQKEREQRERTRQLREELEAQGDDYIERLKDELWSQEFREWLEREEKEREEEARREYDKWLARQAEEQEKEEEEPWVEED
jgi:hypothetical protein